MGLSFDGNGKYVGWSNLFNYDSVEALKASEYLPIPRRKVYIKTDGGTNIDDYIQKIISSKDSAEEVMGYVKLLNYLYENDIVEIAYTIPEGKNVLKKLNDHEFTIIPLNMLEDSNKNFISSHILNTIQNLRNMIGAYSPIDMGRFGDAAKESPKGEQSSRMTMLNPATKLLMLYQNITGKNVIGIAANGEKASFMWHYYINDILIKESKGISTGYYLRILDELLSKLSNSYSSFDVRRYITDSQFRDEVKSNYKEVLELLPVLSDLDKAAEKIQYALFSFKSNRIAGRSKKNSFGIYEKPQEVEINTLPDIIFEDVHPLFKDMFNFRLTGDITVDLMISQILSAATDSRMQ